MKQERIATFNYRSAKLTARKHYQLENCPWRGVLVSFSMSTVASIVLECISFFWFFNVLYLSSSDIHGLSVHLKKSYLSFLSSSHFYEWAAHVTDILAKNEIFQMKPPANSSNYGSVNASQILPHRRNLTSSFAVYYIVCLQMFFSFIYHSNLILQVKFLSRITSLTKMSNYLRKIFLFSRGTCPTKRRIL